MISGGEKILQEKVLSTKNIEMLWCHTLKEIQGEGGVEKVVLNNLKDDSTTELDVSGVFIFIGILPNSKFIDCVEKDQWGFIETDNKMETSVKGIFAIGDCRTTPLLQVASAVGDGSIAACMATGYLEETPYMSAEEEAKG